MGAWLARPSPCAAAPADCHPLLTPRSVALARRLGRHGRATACRSRPIPLPAGSVKRGFADACGGSPLVPPTQPHARSPGRSLGYRSMLATVLRWRQVYGSIGVLGGVGSSPRSGSPCEAPITIILGPTSIHYQKYLVRTSIWTRATLRSCPFGLSSSSTYGRSARPRSPWK